MKWSTRRNEIARGLCSDQIVDLYYSLLSIARRWRGGLQRIEYVVRLAGRTGAVD
jgi:hypothetical protein